MNKRQEQALKTKQKLLDTAADLIIKGNFHSLSIEDITKASGCAKGTFYIYFQNKEQISYEACLSLFKNIAVRMKQMKNKSFTERLQHYFSSFMVEVERLGINACREWIRNTADPKQSLEKTENSKWQFDVQMLRQILKQAVADKELLPETPVELLTHIIISELYGMMICWCMSDGLFEPRDWTEKFFQTQFIPVLRNYLFNKEN